MLRRGGQQGSPDEAFALHQALDGNKLLRNAQIVMAYCALPDEVPLEPLFQKWIDEGKSILLPRVVSDTTMQIHHYTAPNQLEVGAFGIMEPTGEIFTDYAKIDVVIVPGMAFDKQGHRLGRGKGYYDRFLSLCPQTYKIGICYPHRLLDQVPVDAHDILMDAIMTI